MSLGWKISNLPKKYYSKNCNKSQKTEKTGEERDQSSKNYNKKKIENY